MISHLIDITTLSLFHPSSWKTRSAPIATSLAGTLFPTTDPRPSHTSTIRHDGSPQLLQWLFSKKLWNYSQGQTSTVIFNVPWRTQAPPPPAIFLSLINCCIMKVFVLNKNSDTKSNRVKAGLEGSCADYLFTINVISCWCCPERSCRTLANVNHPPNLLTGLHHLSKVAAFIDTLKLFMGVGWLQKSNKTKLELAKTEIRVID